MKLLLNKTRKANLLPNSSAFICSSGFFELLCSPCTDEYSKHLWISLLGPLGGMQMSGKGLVRESTPGMRHPWSAGMAASSAETWRGQGRYITKTALPCLSMLLCTQSFSDYDMKNVNLCVA